MCKLWKIWLNARRWPLASNTRFGEWTQTLYCSSSCYRSLFFLLFWICRISHPVALPKSWLSEQKDAPAMFMHDMILHSLLLSLLPKCEGSMLHNESCVLKLQCENNCFAVLFWSGKQGNWKKVQAVYHYKPLNPKMLNLIASSFSVTQLSR